MEEVRWEQFLMITGIISVLGIVFLILGDITSGGFIIHGERLGYFMTPLFPLSLILSLFVKGEDRE